MKNKRGRKLVALVRQGKDKSQIVIICHGLSWSENKDTNKWLALALQEKGIASLSLDFHGHGESAGNFAETTVSEAVDDIEAAIEFVKSLGYRKIGIVGHSFGGMACNLTAGKHSEIAFAALMSPVSDFRPLWLKRLSKEEIEKWREEGATDYKSSDGSLRKLNYSFWQDLDNNNAYASAGLITCPVLLLHGKADQIIGVTQSKELAKKIKNCEFHLIEGGDHHMHHGKAFEEKRTLVMTFIKRQFE